MRNSLWFGIVVLIIVFLGILTCNMAVSNSYASRIYSNMDELPENNVGLVLGTSKYLKDGGENMFFKYRLQAAADLYIAGKINHVIVSGDNRFASYNEPREMRRELRKMGVPDSLIHLDYAGFRTFDSVIRCQKVFGQNKFTVISQKFHNQRAVFIAQKNHIDAIAYNAMDVGFNSSISTRIREVVARVIVIMDIYVFNTQPKFLGEQIEI